MRKPVPFAAFVAFAFAAMGCPASLDDRCADGACTPLDAGTEGGDAAALDPCSKDPATPACLSDEAALFVSTSGSDAAPGTKAAPLKTIGAAIGKQSPTRMRIYVCEGTYLEDVKIDGKHSGTILVGGFACNWTKSASKPRIGKGTTALTITDASGVGIADVAVTAADASLPGESSIAAFVARSAVTFERVSLEAGRGADGDPGKLTSFTFPDPKDLNGKNGDAPGNGAETKVTCPGDPAGTVSTKGGKGGPSGFVGDPGIPGPANGGTQNPCGAGGTGSDGVAGTSPPAASATQKTGSLTTDGWHPAAGEAGEKGGPGQGGGGGYGASGGIGGGGGAGGCGGAGGGGGQGGGASIALASFQSTVTLAGSSLLASTAGAGGAGAAGQSGQKPGGIGGNRSLATTACNGGNGGPGGDGAPGGGGAGGVSIGVLYKGSAPTLDSDTSANVTAGTKGAPGAGPCNPGVSGISAATLEAKD